MPDGTHAWLLAPAVAVPCTLAGAIGLFAVQADRTIWLASCGRTLFIGCGLASVFYCAATVLIAGGLAAGLGRRRRDRRGGSAVVLGLVVALCCLVALFGATVATAEVLA